MAQEFQALLRKLREDWSMKLRSTKKHRHLAALMDRMDTTDICPRTLPIKLYKVSTAMKFRSIKQCQLELNFNFELASAYKVFGSM